METAALTKRREAELEVAEEMMLGFYLAVTKIVMIKNKLIRGTARDGCLGDKVATLRWFGCIKWRDSECYMKIYGKTEIKR